MGIAKNDTSEADTPKRDGANLSVFVCYDINETCAPNWEKRKALIFCSAVFLVNPNREKHGFSLFLKLAGIALCALLR